MGDIEPGDKNSGERGLDVLLGEGEDEGGKSGVKRG